VGPYPAAPALLKLYIATTNIPLFNQSVKDKANHAVILEKGTAEKLQKDVQSYRLITVATLVDRMKVNGSVARHALKDLEEKGVIRKVVGHARLSVYSKFVISFSLIMVVISDLVGAVEGCFKSG